MQGTGPFHSRGLGRAADAYSAYAHVQRNLADNVVQSLLALSLIQATTRSARALIMKLGAGMWDFRTTLPISVRSPSRGLAQSVSKCLTSEVVEESIGCAGPKCFLGGVNTLGREFGDDVNPCSQIFSTYHLVNKLKLTHTAGDSAESGLDSINCQNHTFQNGHLSATSSSRPASPNKAECGNKSAHCWSRTYRTANIMFAG